MGELLPLVNEELPIAAFDAFQLSGDTRSRLSVCDPRYLSNDNDNSEVGLESALRARNTMHNRVVADAFIPAGGRPSTVHEGNWRQFLQPSNGKPSAKLVVEGANLFITPGAREKLFKECALPIVKDSSANKCGVICSSYEIASSMLLDEKEFLRHKESIVEDVLVRLRSLGQREAELLFREFRARPGALPHFSMRISEAITKLTDAIAARLPDTYSSEEEHQDGGGAYGASSGGSGGDSAISSANAPQHLDDLIHLVHGHLPNKLVELGADRLEAAVPKAYVKYAIASTLASKIVYQEGVEFVGQHPSDDRLAALAFDFLQAEGAVADIVELMGHLDWDAAAAAASGTSASDEVSDSSSQPQQQPRDLARAKEVAMRIVQDGGIRAYLANQIK